MAIVTTGSTVQGLIPGMTRAMSYGSSDLGGGSVVGLPEYLIIVNGNPDAVVTAVIGSQLAYDPFNSKLYMAKTTNGSTWFNVGSRT
jgi:hypothetical protein